MQFLVGWDDAEEAELVSLYLNSSEHQATVVTTTGELIAKAESENWDAVLMSSDEPGEDSDHRYQAFRLVRGANPSTPIVGACRATGIFPMAKFLTGGMRTYILRDVARDYMFLLQATLENVVLSVQAERTAILSEKLRQEIESVRKLQASIIPQEFQSPDGFEIAAQYEPSQIQVLGDQPVTLAGGDYYDAFPLEDGRVVLLVGDASGHGMKACMSIMTMHTLVRMMGQNEFHDTASFVSRINRWLCEQSIVNDEGGFITLLYGVFDPRTREFQWTSAGHPLPLLQDLETNEVRLIGSNDAGGLPLAILPDAEYEIHTTVIPERGRLLIYTDGLEEAFPADVDGHPQFGAEGIADTLRSLPTAAPDDVVQGLMDDSNGFTQGTGRHDDTSVLLLQCADS